MPRPGSKIEKSKDFKGSMIKIAKSLKPWHLVISIALFLAIISTITSIIAPKRLSKLTDYIVDGLKPNINEQTINEISTDNTITASDKTEFFIFLDKSNDLEQEDLFKEMDNLPKPVYEKIEPKMNTKAIKELAIVLVVLYAMGSILGYIQQVIMASVANNYAKSLRTNISKKIERLPLKYFDHNETGDILSRVTNDVDTVSMNLSNSLSSLVGNITLFIGSLIMMFVTNWIMAITGIVASFIGFFFMFIILGKSQKYFMARQEQLGDLNGYIEEMYSGHNVITAYNATETVNDKFDRLNNKLYSSSRNSQFLSGIMGPMMGFIGNLGYVAVCIVGAILVINNQISFGTIISLLIQFPYLRLPYLLSISKSSSVRCSS